MPADLRSRGVRRGRASGAPARSAAARRAEPATRRRAAPSGQRRVRLQWTGPAALVAGLVAVLCLFGLVMVLSASSVSALREHGSAWFFFERQVLYVAAGATVLVIGARVPYQTWRRLSTLVLLASLGMLVVVLVPGIGLSANGSARWLGAGPLQFQPSELAKLGLVLAIADLLTRRADRMRDWRLTLKPALLLVGLVGGLVMLQPDLGTTAVSLGIVLAILFVAGTPVRHLAAVVVGGTGVLLVLGALAPYRRARLLSFLDPCRQLVSRGYQQCEGLVAQGSGHLTGMGLGAGRAKWGFLPNAHTDFIFATIGEDLGLIGTILVVTLFVALAVAGVRVALRAPDRFGVLLATGITAWVVVQAFINVGAVIDILPVTGVPLPFVSFGGTSLVITMGAVGILLNVARHERPVGRVGGGRAAGRRAAARG